VATLLKVNKTKKINVVPTFCVFHLTLDFGRRIIYTFAQNVDSYRRQKVTQFENTVYILGNRVTVAGVGQELQRNEKKTTISD